MSSVSPFWGVAKSIPQTGVCNHEPQWWTQTAAFLKIPPAGDTRRSRLHNLVFHRLFWWFIPPWGGEFSAIVTPLLFLITKGITSSFWGFLSLPLLLLPWLSPCFLFLSWVLILLQGAAQTDCSQLHGQGPGEGKLKETHTLSRLFKLLLNCSKTTWMTCNYRIIIH